MLIKSLFKSVIFRILFVVLALLTAIYQYFWISYNNPDNWRKRPIYNIRITHSDWQSSDISLPSEKIRLTYLLIEPEIAIPFSYRLDREYYSIDLLVNPTGHPWQVNLQLEAHHSDGHLLTIKPSWAGNCGKIEKIIEQSRTRNNRSVFYWGTDFFTKADAIGFQWYPNTGYCDEQLPKTAEYASQFPIILEIYNGEQMIGKEEIPIEIFVNGIARSQIPF